MELSGTATKMEVKPGYKKTEVGMIPIDWSAQALGDKIQLISGQHILAKDYHTEEVGMPYLTGPADFLNGQAIVSKWTNSPKKVAQLNDILLTVKGSGAGSVFKLEIPEAAISRQLMAIRSDSIPHDYIYYFLIFQKGSLSARAVGNLIPGISRQDVLKYEIPLPPTLAEQRAIATALSDVDQLIAALGRLIAKKKAIKLGAMQELLTGRRRLPAFAVDYAKLRRPEKASAGEAGVERKKGYKETEVGRIPEDWDAVPIGNHFDFKNGLNKAKEYFGMGTPIVNYMDVFNFPGLCANNILGKVTLTPDEIRNYSAKKGDVFFTRTSETVDEIGMSSVLLEEVPEAVFSGFVLRARPKTENFDLLFRQYCFRQEAVRKQIISTSSYTTRALTNGRLLYSTEIGFVQT